MDEVNPWQAPAPVQRGPRDRSVFDWQGRAIVISAEVIPAFCPIVEKFHTSVDGIEVPCQKHWLTGEHQFSFDHEGKEIHAEIKQQKVEFRRLKFQLTVDTLQSTNEGLWLQKGTVIPKR